MLITLFTCPTDYSKNLRYGCIWYVLFIWNTHIYLIFMFCFRNMSLVLSHSLYGEMKNIFIEKNNWTLINLIVFTRQNKSLVKQQFWTNASFGVFVHNHAINIDFSRRGKQTHMHSKTSVCTPIKLLDKSDRWVAKSSHFIWSFVPGPTHSSKHTKNHVIQTPYGFRLRGSFQY